MITIINDVHLGVTRVAGTTPRSAAALTDYVSTAFEDMIRYIDGDLIILGDLFDQYLVPNNVLVRTFFALADWIESPDEEGETGRRRLHLVAGNHDLSKDSSRLSSFEMLCKLLVRQFPDGRVRAYLEPGAVICAEARVWVIPHLVNQDVFNLALENVPQHCDYVLLHANYNNGFAEQSDHSLNVSEEQARKLPGFVIFAHEHQARDALNRKVIVIGNQIPSSVADCLGNTYKCFLELGKDSDDEYNVTHVHTWWAKDEFAEIDWRDLKDHVNSEMKFIRVIGEAAAAEAANVVSALSKFRQLSQALVVTNAVKVEGVEVLDSLPDSLESAKAFDVLGALLETLDPPEQATVKRLLGEAQ